MASGDQFAVNTYTAFNFEFQSTVWVGMYYFNTRLLYSSHVLEIQFRDTCTKVAKFSLQYIIM